MKLVTQQSPMGCAVAATASFLDSDYCSTLKLFDNGYIKHSVYGFYVYDVVRALKRKNIITKAYNIKRERPRFKIGDIVFLRDEADDPFGHYLLKTRGGWMDSWKNFPSINPAKAGYRKRLPGKPEWLIRVI